MAEPSITPTDSTPVPTDFADAFDAWIGGAAIAQRSLTIYGKPGLYAQYQDLERQLKIAEQQAQGDESLGDSTVETILTQMQALYDEWMASKSTWYVQALNEDQVKDLKADTQEYDDLDELPEGASDADKAAHAKAQDDLDAKREAAQDDENVRSIAEAVVKIEFANGAVSHSVSVEQLRRLGATLGSRQMLSLLQAAMLVSVEEPEIPAPFLRRTSKPDQT